MRPALALYGLPLIVLSLAACRGDPGVTQDRGKLLDRYVPGLLSEYKVAGAGVAIIEAGKRLRILTSLAGDAIWNCIPAADVQLPAS
jgi:hypothetical protein